jgi:hypothetical protein
MDGNNWDGDEQDDADANIRDSLNGRNTLYCCLSCGIPFAYADDVYIQKNRAVKEIVYFTHYIKHSIRADDRSKASTTQWQLNEAHYIHRSVFFAPSSGLCFCTMACTYSFARPNKQVHAQVDHGKVAGGGAGSIRVGKPELIHRGEVKKIPNVPNAACQLFIF